MDYREKAEELFVNMTQMSKHVTMKGVGDIAKGELSILGYLQYSHNGATAGELSEVTCVVSSRIAAVLNSLEKKGYAERRRDLKDKRKVLVYITEDGREFVQHKYNCVIDAVGKSLSLLGEEDTMALLRIVKKLAEQEEYIAMYNDL